MLGAGSAGKTGAWCFTSPNGADDLPVLPSATQADWAAWLEDNHDEAPGLWLKIAKKASGIATVTHAEALEAALCFGWIDGQRGRFDDEWFIQRFTPRRTRSRWSQIHDAKRADTRSRRIDEFVAMLARRETIH